MLPPEAVNVCVGLVPGVFGIQVPVPGLVVIWSLATNKLSKNKSAMQQVVVRH